MTTLEQVDGLLLTAVGQKVTKLLHSENRML